MEITGQTFVDLRRRRNGLSRRLGLISLAVEPLYDLQAMFTEEMFSAWIEHRRFMDEDRDYDEEYAVGLTRIITDDFFDALLPHPYGSNIVGEFNSIGKLSKQRFDMLDASIVPLSFKDWTSEELRFVVSGYRSQITDAIHRLRDINTHWKYLTGHRHPMPSFIKSSVMGLFGGPDQDHGFVYSDADFQFLQNGSPKVMTAKWLAPFVGINHARTIESALTVISESSKPREGEPDTINFFGSHVTNKIDVFD